MEENLHVVCVICQFTLHVIWLRIYIDHGFGSLFVLPVVNIDNGFGAAALAFKCLRQMEK